MSDSKLSRPTHTGHCFKKIKMWAAAQSDAESFQVHHITTITSGSGRGLVVGGTAFGRQDSPICPWAWSAYITSHKFTSETKNSKALLISINSLRKWQWNLSTGSSLRETKHTACIADGKDMDIYQNMPMELSAADLSQTMANFCIFIVIRTPQHLKKL